MEECRAKRAFASGLMRLTVFWGADSYRHFDGVLAMYHDQGLAPFKALAMDDEGVNFTAGLPVVEDFS